LFSHTTHRKKRVEQNAFFETQTTTRALVQLVYSALLDVEYLRRSTLRT